MSCANNAIPAYESLGLPADINVGLTPKNNASMAAMERCCAPNPVEIVEDCTLWCELPDQFMEGLSEEDILPLILSDCLQRNKSNSSDIRAVMAHRAESLAVPATRPTMAGFGIFTLLVLGVVIS